jgi:ribonuclease T2
MKQAVLFVVFALVACRSNQEPNSTHPNPMPSAQPANVPVGSGFDYYLLNLSWSPEFCYSHPTAAECASHSTFVLHGIWPQNNDGTYPENCSNAPGPSDPSSFSDIYPDPGLLEHEWRTHGTCSGLGADAFFGAARAALRSITIPPQLNNLSTQISMPPDEIVSLFARANPSIPQESIAVSCGHNYLTAVEFCLDKSLRPVACGPIRSCRANTVRIPPPR